jgi:predicted metalloprotease with PDZ domain
MPQLTTAGRLLANLNREGAALRDAVANAAGVTVERAIAAMRGMVRLTLSEQLRLSEAATTLAPTFTRDAEILRTKVLSARSYESPVLIEVHHDDRGDKCADTQVGAPRAALPPTSANPSQDGR